jgi:succinoglycan biosynthesis transport protein ExoP
MPDLEDGTSVSTDVPGLVQAMRVLRERWWVVLVCAVVSLGVALVYLERQPKQYTATAKLQFTASSIPSQVAGVPQNQSVDPEGEKATNLQLVTATPVAALVVKALKLSVTPATLLEEVTASNPNNDYIVDVVVTNGRPKLATAIANEFAQQYVVYSQQQNEAQLIKGEQLINRKLAQLPTSDLADRANLRALSQKLLVLQAVQSGNAKVVGTAGVPGTPSSPKTRSTAVVALIVGLLLGAGLAFMFNLIDRRIKSLEEFEELYKLPALASVPRLTRKLDSKQQSDLELEPFRILRNGLALMGRNGGTVKTVLVTSAVASEGKTTVALGLARASALSGQHVILVDADLRRPSLGPRLGIAGAARRGLTSSLLDGDDPLELLSAPLQGIDRLKVLASGPIPPQASDLLRSEQLAHVLARLASPADLLVIDSAPLLPVVDTRTLLDDVHLDACLIVARVGTTTRDQARRVHSVFDRRRLAGVGLVVNELTDISGNYYYDNQSATVDTDDRSRRTGTMPRKAASESVSRTPSGIN